MISLTVFIWIEYELPSISCNHFFHSLIHAKRHNIPFLVRVNRHNIPGRNHEFTFTWKYWWKMSILSSILPAILLPILSRLLLTVKALTLNKLPHKNTRKKVEFVNHSSIPLELIRSFARRWHWFLCHFPPQNHRTFAKQTIPIGNCWKKHPFSLRVRIEYRSSNVELH